MNCIGYPTGPSVYYTNSVKEKVTIWSVVPWSTGVDQEVDDTKLSPVSAPVSTPDTEKETSLTSVSSVLLWSLCKNFNTILCVIHYKWVYR